MGQGCDASVVLGRHIRIGRLYAAVGAAIVVIPAHPRRLVARAGPRCVRRPACVRRACRSFCSPSSALQPDACSMCCSTCPRTISASVPGAGQSDPKTKKEIRLTWDNHRWIRYRTFMAAFELVGRKFGVTWQRSDWPEAQQTYPELLEEPPSYKLTAPQQQFAAAATEELVDMGRGRNPSTIRRLIPTDVRRGRSRSCASCRREQATRAPSGWVSSASCRC